MGGLRADSESPCALLRHGYRQQITQEIAIVLNLIAVIFGRLNFDLIGSEVDESRLLIGSVITAI